MKEVDARGLACPQPVILTKKALEEIDQGEVIAIVDNITAKENVSRLASNLGCPFEVSETEGCHYIRIKKTGAEGAAKEANQDIVILVGTDKLGQGDEALGSLLMKSYTYALTEVAPLPKAMLFLNSGVKLTSEGSAILENLEKLAAQGVEIVSCGTCLDFYQLKEKLKVGTIGNMYAIIEKMHAAAKVVTLG